MFNWVKKFFASGSGNTIWALLGGASKGTSRVSLSRAELESLFYGWVYASVAARSEDIGDIQFKLYKKTKKGIEEVLVHPILQTLHKFNNSMSKSDGIGLLSMHLDIFGRGYWLVKDGIGDGTKTLIPLMPDDVTPVCDVDGEIQSWVRKIPGQNGQSETEELELGQIVQFREMNPFKINGYYSIVQAAYEWIVTELNSTNWNMNFFKNNAIPSSLLKTAKPIGKESEKRLNASFKESFSGTSNAHKLGILPHGVDLIQLSSSMKDMDFTNLDVRYQNKILAMFRVPRTRLGLTDDVNRANAEATNYVYALRAIKPQMQKMIDTLNEFYVPLFEDSDDLVLDFVSPVPEDEQLKLEKYSKGLMNQPYLTVNEVREREGLLPVENGDSLMTTLQFVPLGDPIQKTVKAPAAGVREKSISRIIRGRRGKHFVREKARKAIATAFMDSYKDALKGFTSRDMDEVLHKQFVGRAEQKMKAIELGMEKVNKQVEKEIKKALPGLIKDAKKEAKVFVKSTATDLKKTILGITVLTLTSPLTDISAEESLATQRNLSIVGDFVISASLQKEVDRFIKKLGKSYSKSIVNDVGKQVTTGLTDGLGIKEIERNIRNNVFDGTMKTRSAAISRSEVFRFSNLGLRDGYKESGVVATVRWYTAEDERVCQWCGPLEGKTVDVEQRFFNKGEKVIGNDGGVLNLDYGEVLGGPLHPNCRCYVRPEKISII